jgi:two-component system nitrogen regulation response regulator GlnG
VILVRQAFPAPSHRVAVARTGAEGVAREALPDVVLLKVELPDRSGVAVEAINQRAKDCLCKPPGQVAGEALGIARRLRERSLAAEPIAAPETSAPLVCTCPAMRQVYKEFGLVAAHDVPIIITGESGIGKELVAHAICQHGPRAKAPFLVLNCAIILENLLES